MLAANKLGPILRRNELDEEDDDDDDDDDAEQDDEDEEEPTTCTALRKFMFDIPARVADITRFYKGKMIPGEHGVQALQITAVEDIQNMTSFTAEGPVYSIDRKYKASFIKALQELAGVSLEPSPVGARHLVQNNPGGITLSMILLALEAVGCRSIQAAYHLPPRRDLMFICSDHFANYSTSDLNTFELGYRLYFHDEPSSRSRHRRPSP